MYGKNGYNYLSSNLDYSEFYRNKTKSLTENRSDLKKSGENVMNMQTNQKYKKDNNLLINYSNPSKNSFQYPIEYDILDKLGSQINSEMSNNILSKTSPRNNIKYSNEMNNDQIKKKDLEEVYKKKVGFENVGNSCYMNTALQCLLHSKKFINRFLSVFNHNDTITSCIYEIITQLSKSSDLSSYDPSNFIRAFEFYHKKYKGFRQHDSQEFLRIFLEDISKELNVVKIPPRYKELETFKKTKKELNSNYHKLFLERENSIIVDLFYSQICNTFTCTKCYNSTYSFEKIIDIPLLIGKHKLTKENENYCDIYDMISNFFKEETILFDSKCLKCNAKCNHIKSIKISSLPQILIISIQRYNQRTQRKNTCKISFSPSIDIIKYVDKDCIEYSQITKYNLFAISNHSGALDFGHYFAYCKIDNSWYELNDSRVLKLTELQKESSYVYALFYEKSEGVLF